MILDLFWHKVADAYNQVAVDNSRKLSITEGDKTATVVYYPKTDTILIGVSQFNDTSPPTLIVP